MEVLQNMIVSALDSKYVAYFYPLMGVLLMLMQLNSMYMYYPWYF